MLAALVATFLLQAATPELPQLYEQGHTFMEEGQYHQAERVLTESAARNPEHVPTLKALARTYSRLGHLEEALDINRRVVELAPDDMRARGHLAEIYSWTGDHDKSIVTYRDALELAPGNPYLKTGLARVLRWSHRYDEAERQYREVLEDSPENHEALKGLAKTYAMSGELARAGEYLNRAIELYPDDPELRKEMGTVLGWSKDYRGAVESLEKAVELSPNYAEAWRTMGDVYTWMRSFGDAVRAYEKARDLEPDNVDNYLLIARTHLRAGDEEAAENTVKAALRVDPSSVRALDMIRELRGGDDTPLVEKVGDIVEAFAFVFVFILLVLAYRNKRRMLMRRHRLYFYFISFVLPALVIITLASFFGRDYLTEWVDRAVVEDLTEATLFIGLGASLLALLWIEHRGRDYSRMTVLVVGAHPDDIELGCGGFIMKAKDSGASVYGITLTRGEKGTNKEGKREEELGRAARYMEMDGFWTYDFPDTDLPSCVSEMKDVLEEKIKEVNATVVATHTAIDVHADHRAVFEATKVAGRNISILCYEDVSTPREFVPNYFVDITGYIEDKLRLIGFHKTQGNKTYMDPEVIKGRSAHRGLQSGVQYAEAFRIYRLLR